MSEVLQRLDYYVCGIGFTQQVLDIIQENPEEFNDFIVLVNGAINCETINACGPIPTTTTTSTSLTTTTTTSSSTTTTTTTTMLTTTTTTSSETNCVEYTLSLVDPEIPVIASYINCSGESSTILVTSPGIVLEPVPPIVICAREGSVVPEENLLLSLVGNCNPSSCVSVQFLIPRTPELVIYTDCEGIAQSFYLTNDDEELPPICLNFDSLVTNAGYFITGGCGETTTTTSTSSSTTTTTTTESPSLRITTISSSSSMTDACGFSMPNTVYVQGNYVRVFVDSGGTTPFDGGNLYWKMKRDIDAFSVSALIQPNGFVSGGISVCL